jgi:DNA polymerase-1
MNKKAIVIDGNSLIYRAFYATLGQLEYYKSHNLPPVNALKLVLLIILKLITNEEYTYALLAFDHQKKTLRHDTFADYKAGRKPMPEDLVAQLPLIKEAIKLLGIHTMSLEGIEADDIIGSFTKKMNQDNVDVEIFSSDKDMMQLVNEHTVLNMFKTGISDIKKITLDNFSENFFGLYPQQVPDFKGISGDSSDNLCGVKGIGPQTASMLIRQYGSLEAIYNVLDKLSEGQRNKFISCKDHAFMCKQLSIIDTKVIDNIKIDDFLKKPIDKKAFSELVDKYHFKGFEKYLLDQQRSLF